MIHCAHEGVLYVCEMLYHGMIVFVWIMCNVEVFEIGQQPRMAKGQRNETSSGNTH